MVRAILITAPCQPSWRRISRWGDHPGGFAPLDEEALKAHASISKVDRSVVAAAPAAAAAAAKDPLLGKTGQFRASGLDLPTPEVISALQEKAQAMEMKEVKKATPCGCADERAMRNALRPFTSQTRKAKCAQRCVDSRSVRGRDGRECASIPAPVQSVAHAPVPVHVRVPMRVIPVPAPTPGAKPHSIFLPSRLHITLAYISTPANSALFSVRPSFYCYCALTGCTNQHRTAQRQAPAGFELECVTLLLWYMIRSGA
jgi:hypothetical protein